MIKVLICLMNANKVGNTRAIYIEQDWISFIPMMPGNAKELQGTKPKETEEQ